MTSILANGQAAGTIGMVVWLVVLMDEVVIVEFGNNKNCRIPMQKAAIADLEKAEDSAK